ncbi:MAG: DUF1003 domain-containing protein [Pseudomonadota bacterium]
MTADPKRRHDSACRSVEELTRHNVKTIARLEAAIAARSTGMDELALKVSAFCGSGGFVWLHVLWFAGWVTLNSVPGVPHFDPFPFTFLTLVVSLEAIFLAAFILMTQNRAARVGDLRNQLDLQLNLLTEQETTKLLRLVQAMADKMGVEDGGDPPIEVLEQATDPERLARQIERYQASPRT